MLRPLFSQLGLRKLWCLALASGHLHQGLNKSDSVASLACMGRSSYLVAKLGRPAFISLPVAHQGPEGRGQDLLLLLRPGQRRHSTPPMPHWVEWIWYHLFIAAACSIPCNNAT
ncbi:uncharacterized protein BO80DRAFT_54310 [Aspergillus ibericus CBS 121593]|uniref:Secreted protein n=1 Tax=Aspergillus ibericus CBS 121593 TaxID=1448316 RepID=A0A395H5X8_9EURO|nr:hypothetical protein BO80DRAFT_54310 [Aspergillus ibericus CBS 121593]RAL01674.1 hypothetical protein BO80DRAFT_54310 [Aspergillus ibericus CBS 121593]